MPVRKAFEELSRQLGVQFKPDPKDLFEGKVVTLDIADQPFWTAMKAICATNQLAPEVGRGGIISVGQDPGWAMRPASISSTAIVQPYGIDVSRSVKMGRTPVVSAACSVEVTVTLDPRLRLLYLKRLHVETMTDEAGHAIEQAPYEWPEGEQAMNDGTRLQIKPLPDSHRIARLEGYCVAVIQTKSEKLEVDDIVHANGVEKIVGGVRFVVTTRAFGGNYTVEYNAYRPPNVSFPVFIARIQSVEGTLLDAAGQPYTWAGGSTNGLGNDGLHVESHFQQKSFSNPKAPEPGAPARFVLEVPAETREVHTPFDFTDLPLP